MKSEYELGGSLRYLLSTYYEGEQKIERTKFNVDKNIEKRTYDGIVFDSILEMKYYRDVLCPLVKSGDVVYYELQKPYELQPEFIHDSKKVRAVVYIADFFIRYMDGREEVIDTKGCPDSTAILKRKLFWYTYPNVDYKWMTFVKKFGGWLEYDIVKKLRAEAKRQKTKEKAANELKEDGHGKD